MPENHQITVKEENRKIRYLRFLVDLNLGVIMSGDVSLEESQKIITRLREISENLFPGKGYVFDLVYLPRFKRAIKGVFNSSFQ
jgi:hypothetical protein